MDYSILEGKHSADKDHTTMTGGTLSVDKKVTCDEGVTFYTYTVPMYSDGVYDDTFHKGVHTAEHLLAYKKDTGSVRNSLEEVTHQKIPGKVILDISPYQTGANTFGFRITSLVPLEVEQVRELTKTSVQRAIDFLQKEDVVPFATPEQCGQYDFHSIPQAIEDLQKIQVENLEIQQDTYNSKHTTAYVCDLRFLKPKLLGNNDMVMFSPDLSYRISELIEAELPKKLPGTITLVGTFGCMTGMYLCVSSENGDESDIPKIHQNIIALLQEEIDGESLNETEKIQLSTLIENYEKFGKK